MAGTLASSNVGKDDAVTSFSSIVLPSGGISNVSEMTFSSKASDSNSIPSKEKDDGRSGGGPSGSSGGGVSGRLGRDSEESWRIFLLVGNSASSPVFSGYSSMVCDGLSVTSGNESGRRLFEGLVDISSGSGSIIRESNSALLRVHSSFFLMVRNDDLVVTTASLAGLSGIGGSLLVVEESTGSSGSISKGKSSGGGGRSGMGGGGAVGTSSSSSSCIGRTSDSFSN